jgi:hypothetical protein
MKPLQIVLLVAAAGIGGALVVKVSQNRTPEPEQVVAQAPSPSPAPVAAPTPAPVVEPAAPVVVKPSPMEAPKAGRVRVRNETPAPPAQPVATPAAPPASAAAHEPAARVETPGPAPVPPARVEPEHVTPPPPPAPPEPHRVTLNAGTMLQVRLVDGLTSERNMPGDRFTATLDKELAVDGFVLAERGARVEGQVVTSDRGGRVSGVASLGVELTRLRLSDGQTVAISTDSFERHAEQSRRDDATKVGAGAAIGAVIGAIAGGGKGAAIGAGAGGAAGAGAVMATRGKAATLPSETRVPFRLSAPVTVTERR